MGSSPCRSGGRIFFSRVNFLCWLIICLLHAHVTTVACKRSWSFFQKYRWQVTLNLHAPYVCSFAWSVVVNGYMVYTEHAETAEVPCGTSMKCHGAWLYGVHRTCCDSRSSMWHQHEVSWCMVIWCTQNMLRQQKFHVAPAWSVMVHGYMVYTEHAKTAEVPCGTSMKCHGAWLYGVHRTCWDSRSSMWHQPCQHRKYTTSVEVQKRTIKS